MPRALGLSRAENLAEPASKALRAIEEDQAPGVNLPTTVEEIEAMSWD